MLLQQIVISESSAGLYYDRTKVLYAKKYGHEFSDDKVAKMKSLRIEEYDYYVIGNDVVVIATVYSVELNLYVHQHMASV